MLISPTCEEADLASMSGPPYFAFEVHERLFVMFHCYELTDDDCIAADYGHLVGSLDQPTGDGYGIDVVVAEATSATCYGVHTRASVTKEGSAVRISLLERRASWPLTEGPCDDAAAVAHEDELGCVVLEHLEGNFLMSTPYR
jgi:hypothetical protein